MENMVPIPVSNNDLALFPDRFELAQVDHGIYESFYFRGNLKESKKSFWLKHNLLQFNDDTKVRIDNALIIFDDEKKASHVFSQTVTLTRETFMRLYGQSGHWWKLQVPVDGGGFFELARHEDGACRLKGVIPLGQGKKAEWDLELKMTGMIYAHFDKLWFYRGFFPKKKILTADCFVEYEGRIKTPEGDWQGHWRGMNGHNWGKEHAYQYAYTNCNEFLDEGKFIDEAFFDGFSAKIKIGPIVTPYLSAGSLFYKGKWYNFNRVMGSWKHDVHELVKKVYHVTFISNDYQMDVSINGQEAVWVTLDYDHPTRKVSQVHNCKHAKGKIRLTNSKNQQVIASLYSPHFELESLMAPAATPS